MQVVGVNGSGRVGGNTSVLVKAILKGAAEAGSDTHLLELGSLSIRGCDSCRACKRNHRCVIKDDMERFYELAPTADVLVLASPIYLDHVTAQMETFYQRTYCYLGSKLDNFWPRKDVRAVLAITYGASNPQIYDRVLDRLAAGLKRYYDITTIGRFKVPSAQRDVFITSDHPEVQRAYAFGAALRA